MTNCCRAAGLRRQMSSLHLALALCEVQHTAAHTAISGLHVRHSKVDARVVWAYNPQRDVNPPRSGVVQQAFLRLTATEYLFTEDIFQVEALVNNPCNSPYCFRGNPGHQMLFRSCHHSTL